MTKNINHPSIYEKISFKSLFNSVSIYLFFVFLIDLIWRESSLMLHYNLIETIRAISGMMAGILILSLLLTSILFCCGYLLKSLANNSSVLSLYYRLILYVFVSVIALMYVIQIYVSTAHSGFFGAHYLKYTALFLFLVFTWVYLYKSDKISTLFYSWLAKHSKIVNYIYISTMALFVFFAAEKAFSSPAKIDKSVWSITSSRNNKVNNKQKKGNIILITIDTLTARHMSLYGYSRETTPNFEQLAKTAFIFNNFHSNAGWTRFGLESLFLSRHPFIYVGGDIEKVNDNIYSAGIYKMLFDEGYELIKPVTGKSAQYTFWFIDDFIFNVCGGHTWVTEFEFMYYYLFENSIRRMFGWIYETHCDEIVVREAINKIQNAKSPFFLWVHFFGPHEFEFAVPGDKYRILNKNSKDALINNYDDLIHYTDVQLGEIVNYLKKINKFDNTMLIITADHGLHAANNSLYEKNMNIPLLIHGFGQKYTKTITTNGEQVDLLPTLAEYLGIKLHMRIDGESLMKYFDGGKSNKPKYSMNFRTVSYSRPFIGQKKGAMSVYLNGYKLIYNMEKDTTELYDLWSDPDEKINLSDQMPEMVKKLKWKIVNKISVADIKSGRKK